VPARVDPGRQDEPVVVQMATTRRGDFRFG